MPAPPSTGAWSMSWSEATDPAPAYARTLLARHGIDADVPEAEQPRTTAADWADSGAMDLTGTPDGPPRLVDGAPATTMRGALIALAALARTAGLDPTRLPDHRALSERAAVMGLRRAGRQSAGGATRLLEAADGTLALTLSRDDDFAAVPALLEVHEVAGDPWASIASIVSSPPRRRPRRARRLTGTRSGHGRPRPRRAQRYWPLRRVFEAQNVGLGGTSGRRPVRTMGRPALRAPARPARRARRGRRELSPSRPHPPRRARLPPTPSR